MTGYHWEWHPDEGSRIATAEEREQRKCRFPRCGREPVMAFLRPRYGGSRTSRHWWLYCADHMYGRRIEDGVVKFKRLVPDELEVTQ